MIFVMNEWHYTSHTSIHRSLISITVPSIEKNKLIHWQTIHIRMAVTPVVVITMYHWELLQEYKWPTAQPLTFKSTIMFTWDHAHSRPCSLWAPLSQTEQENDSKAGPFWWDTGLLWVIPMDGSLTISKAETDMGLCYSPNLPLLNSHPFPLSFHICQAFSVGWRWCLTSLDASSNKSLGFLIPSWHLLLSKHKLT